MTRLTRRQFVVGGAGVLAAAGGIYELVDRFASAPTRQAVRRLPEQHVLPGLRVVTDNHVEVLVPPLHNAVLTGRLTVGESGKGVRSAQDELESALAGLEEGLDHSPAGLGVTVAWGLPYFRRYVPGPAARNLPVDLRATEAAGRQVQALIDAVRFPSDPADVRLEENDVVFFFRGDRLEHVDLGIEAVRGLGGLLEPTSVRRGFAGGGFGGGQSLPKRMALAAGVPGAQLIPETAELFLGFTSTQKAGLGPLLIANYETLPGYTDQWPDGYFRGGTAMHLSHILEDVEAWYLNFDFQERIDTVFRPGERVPSGTQTVRQAPEDVSTAGRVVRDFHRSGGIGHSASIQPSSRLQADVTGRDGAQYPKGTAIPQRADFNTLDNPFAWTSRPEQDGWSPQPAAGVHFVVFNPTSDDFHRNRLAMDGRLPDGTRLPIDPRDRGQGINSVLRTTHRQNFLVPPRKHRSFPLAELL